MRGLILAAVLASGCGDDGKPALFPADYATTYQEVRNCRHSLDHDLMQIRVLASPDAVAPYTQRTAFPTGAIVIKEQYADNDLTCAKAVVTYTAMEKLEPGSSTATLDWTWQKADAELREVQTDTTRCVRCHTMCGQPPDGYDGTCTVP